MADLPPLDSDIEEPIQREILRIAGFTLVPAEPHPFYKAIPDDGGDVPHSLRGVFTSRAEAIRRVKEFVEGSQK